MSAAKHYEVMALEDNVLMHNLKQLMYQSHINEAELARQTHIPQPTIHKILAGNTTDPRVSTLRQLADYFQVSIDELYIPNNSFTLQSKAKTQSVPIISWSDCVKGSAYIKNLSSNNWQNWLVTESLGENAFALTSKPSMEPHFPRSTLLIINPEVIPSDGDFVVVHYAGTEEAALRELIIDGPNKLLISLNPNANKDCLDKNVTILGVLIQSRFAHHSN